MRFFFMCHCLVLLALLAMCGTVAVVYKDNCFYEGVKHVGAIIVVSILLSIFSTAVMCYISMATPIGPWIAPTLVLCALLLFNLFTRRVTSTALALATSAGSIGGIMATAVGLLIQLFIF